LDAVVFSFPFSFPLSLTFSPWFRFICLIKLLVSQRNRPHSGQFFPKIFYYGALSAVLFCLGRVIVSLRKQKCIVAKVVVNTTISYSRSIQFITGSISKTGIHLHNFLEQNIIIKRFLFFTLSTHSTRTLLAYKFSQTLGQPQG
jgi:hypothetical protein